MTGGIVFAVAAGPRLGFGHLLRSRALSRALGVPFVVALRGGRPAQRAARRIGAAFVQASTRALAARRPSLLVIDDPSRNAAAVWVGRARRLRIRVASIHDAGLGYVGSDLRVDGSFTPGPADLAGPRFAILDPGWSARRAMPARRQAGHVLIALGGGQHVRQFGAVLAQAVARAVPGLRILVAPGFAAGRRPALPAAARWLERPDAFGQALASCSAAVLAGGMTLYEACAVGTPAVAIAVVPAQRPTIAAAARVGAVLDGGTIRHRRGVIRVADAVRRVLADPTLARALARTARATVDGAGAARVARMLHGLAGRMEHADAA